MDEAAPLTLDVPFGEILAKVFVRAVVAWVCTFAHDKTCSHITS